MGIEMGRVSGPLLSENLLRNGENLAFDTDLLYIDVVNGKVGVKSDSPTRELFAKNSIGTTNLIVDTQMDVGNFSIFDSKIQQLTGAIYFQPNQSTDPIIQTPDLSTANIRIRVGQIIENVVDNTGINLSPIGTGQVSVTSNSLEIFGNLHSNGNITADGNIILGTGTADTVIFNSDITSNIIPDVNDTYDLGSPSKIWQTLYTENVVSDAITTTDFNTSIDLLLVAGNTIYVSVNGNDTNYGNHLHSTYRTIKQALTVAQPGDEVVIFPGTYSEIFPLTVPQGVSVRGMDVRNVIVTPTSSTNTNNAFLLNGETTVSFITVKDFFAPGNGFSFANNFTVTTRSPYVQNVTVITKTAAIQTQVNQNLSGTSSPTGFFYYGWQILNPGQTVPTFSVIQPGWTVAGQPTWVVTTVGNGITNYDITITGGLFASGGTYSFISPLTGAGNGALVDGSLANSASIQATMLFHAVTMIVPDAIGIQASNGARVEWLNSFTYFANKGIYLTDGTNGFAGIRNTAAGYDNIVGFYGQSGILLTGANAKTVTVNVSVSGVITIVSVSAGAASGIFTSAGGTRWIINLGKFGAEMRSINSANVYGTYGAVADGASTLGYLIGHNFGYIGTGADSQNDYGLVNQANEIVATNGAALYYDSMDHKGDYRIGDIFLVDQDTGSVTFNAQSINFTANGNITFEGPTGSTIINAQSITTGNIRIHDNNLDSLSGPINFLAASNTTRLNTNVFVTGIIDISADTNVKGNVFLGNDPLDLLTVAPQLTQTIPPNTTDTYTLGTVDKTWKTAKITTLTIDNVTQITNNTATTLTSNTDLRLVAAGTGRLYVPLTNVEADNNFTVNSPISILDLGINGNVIITGDINQTGDRLITGYGVFENITTHVGTMQFGDIFIENNIFSTVVTNQNLEISANGTGRIYVPYKNVKINNNLTVSSDSYFTTTNVTTTATANEFFTGDISIDNNVITTTLTNQDLSLKAALTGKIYVPSNNVLITNDLTVTTNLTVTTGLTSVLDTEITGVVTLTGNINQTGGNDIIGMFANNNISITSTNSYLDIPNIRILHNVLSVTAVNTDLILTANGTGGIGLDQYLKIADTIISNNRIGATSDLQKSIKFSPNGTGNVVVSTTKALELPNGSNTTRTFSAIGEIRYNTVSNLVEGWQPSGYVNFANLWDSDRNTYITAELTPGAADSTLRFSINSAVSATISDTALTTNSLLIDNVKILGNAISNNIASTNLNILPTSGLTNFKNSIHVTNNTIETVSAGPITLLSTGFGYVKFSGNKAVIIPHGGPLDRRNTPELGETRYNTDAGELEIYDGYAWVSAVGSGGFASPAEIDDIMNVWSFILG